MKKCLAVCSAAVLLVALVGLASGCKSSRPKGKFVVSDIKGDSLGMSLEEYMKKHPDSHCESEQAACVDVSGTTYAGVAVNKSAGFTGARLYDLTYFGASQFYHDQLLTALKEKYGEPRCVVSGDDRNCEWWNGTATIRFFSSPIGTSVSFRLDDLSAAAARKTEEANAQARKTDQ